MRLWHTRLIPILPREQLIAQWRELSAIAGSIQQKGTPNHILVNFVLDYDYDNFISYAKLVREELDRRNYKTMNSVWDKITALKPDWQLMKVEDIYFRKMNNFYYDVCLYNLMEKLNCGGVKEEPYRSLIMDAFVNREESKNDVWRAAD